MTNEAPTPSPQLMSLYRKSLRDAGVAIVGLQFAELHAEYVKLKADIEIEPAPAPTPEPETLDIDVDTLLTELADIEIEPAPAPKPETPTPPPKPIGLADTLSNAIADTLAKTLAEFEKPAPSIDENQIIDLINKHATITHKLVVDRSQLDKPELELTDYHPVLEEVVDWIQRNENVYLCGNAGSGKTTLAKQAAAALGLRFYASGAISDAYQLLGYKDVTSEYQTTQFRNCWENGGLFLQDEIDASCPNALLALNNALDNGWQCFPDNPEAPIAQHKDFKIIAAANTIGSGANRQYVGRNVLDGATLNRYQIVEVGYDEALEDRIALDAYNEYAPEKVTQLTSPLKSFIRTIRHYRKAVEALQLPVIFSPRNTRRGAKLIAGGFGTQAAITRVLDIMLTDDQKTRIEKWVS